jgi:hypothetical protein
VAGNTSLRRLLEGVVRAGAERRGDFVAGQSGAQMYVDR